MADDLGYGDLRCMGQKIVKTPNLDRLARQGTRFTRFYAGNTVCAPSRCALMTGKDMGHAYVRGNGGGDIPLRLTDTTIALRLRNRGYQTGMFGKWGLGNDTNSGAPQKQGWVQFLGYLRHGHAHNYYTDSLWQVKNGELSILRTNPGQYTHELIINAATSFIRDNRAKPFFLYLPVTLVHAELATTSDDEKPFLTADGKSIFPETPYLRKPNTIFTRYSAQPNPHAAFAAMLSRLDRDVGKLMDLLTELGLDQTTYVFFTSDNGPHDEGGADPTFFDSNGPLRGMKRDLYEGGIRVPMPVRGPGVPAYRVNTMAWANWDILPTLCDLTATPKPTDITGLSMVSLLRGEPSPAPADRTFYWAFNEGEYRRALLQGNWKLIWLKRPDEAARLELYDLAHDLGETTNLANQNPAKVRMLTDLMQRASTPAEHPLFDWSKLN
ncbi:arylsulfatase [Spirosoma arcticum]